MMEDKRVEWVDTLKFLGILAIYVGHFLELGGLSHKFIFAFAVELFFFVSGLFAIQHTDRPLGEQIKKRFAAIVVPYYFFSVLTAAVIAVQGNYGMEQLRPMAKQILFGIRNRTVAPTLWFLPCLFVVFLLYELLYRLIKKEWALVGIGLLLYAVSALWLKPVEQPRWIFNVDSAVYYFFFYALGAAYFRRANEAKKPAGILEKAALCIGAGCVIGISAYMYLGKMIDAYQVLKAVPGFTLFYPLMISTVLIAFQVMLSKLFSSLAFLGKLGRKTLYLCGNEYLIKLLAPECLGILGFGIELSNPLRVYLYSFGLILAAYFILIPWQEKLIGRLTAGILDFCQERGYTTKDS